MSASLLKGKRIQGELEAAYETVGGGWCASTYRRRELRVQYVQYIGDKASLGVVAATSPPANRVTPPYHKSLATAQYAYLVRLTRAPPLEFLNPSQPSRPQLAYVARDFAELLSWLRASLSVGFFHFVNIYIAFGFEADSGW